MTPEISSISTNYINEITRIKSDLDPKPIFKALRCKRY